MVIFSYPVQNACSSIATAHDASTSYKFKLCNNFPFGKCI